MSHAGSDFIRAATRLLRGGVRKGPGIGVDELGTAFLDNTHDPTQLTAGSLYAEANQSIPINVGIVTVGTISLAYTSLINRLAAMHVGGSQASSAMSVSGLTNAGTGATCVVTGNDVSGSIVFTPGSAAWAAGAQFSVAFKTAFLATPQVVLTPTNSQAGANSGTRGVYITKNASGFTVNFTSAVAAATAWTWDYAVFGI